MSRHIKNISRVLLIVLAVLGGVLTVMAVYHHIRLFVEAAEIKPVGQLVEVNGRRMNVYTEGEGQSADTPTLVLLSGSGVSAPIYDYKVLYSELSESYKVAVVEKFGYGYSDVSGFPRDVATMVEEDRLALKQAGQTAPYVLMPHSMSALEAIYWAHTYPDEVAAIVGLDMAVPESYQIDNLPQITLMKVGEFFGFHRFPVFNPVSSLGLTEEEFRQHRLLNARNSLNGDVYEECKTVFKNAQTVLNMDISSVPILMFTTNLGGSAGGEQWMAAQDAFAARMGRCERVFYDCGHNLHYEKPAQIADAIQNFLNDLKKDG